MGLVLSRGILRACPDTCFLEEYIKSMESVVKSYQFSRLLLGSFFSTKDNAKLRDIM